MYLEKLTYNLEFGIGGVLNFSLGKCHLLSNIIAKP
jgi:hypothetical protein